LFTRHKTISCDGHSSFHMTAWCSSEDRKMVIKWLRLLLLLVVWYWHCVLLSNSSTQRPLLWKSYCVNRGSVFWLGVPAFSLLLSVFCGEWLVPSCMWVVRKAYHFSSMLSLHYFVWETLRALWAISGLSLCLSAIMALGQISAVHLMRSGC